MAVEEINRTPAGAVPVEDLDQIGTAVVEDIEVARKRIFSEGSSHHSRQAIK